MPEIEPSVYPTGTPPEQAITMLDPNTIQWDDRYQKPADLDWVAAIVRNYNPDFFLPTLVSSRNGSGYYMVDGMNRREVAIRLGIQLPAIVYPDCTLEREAAIFKSVNHDRRVVHFYETLRAAVVAGQPWALDIMRICAACGLELELSGNQPQHGRIAAVKSLYIAYKHGNLYKTLKTLMNAWGNGDHRVFQRAIITGLSSFLFRYEDYVNEGILHIALRRTTYQSLLNQASRIQGERSVTANSYTADTLARGVAEALKTAYDFKLPKADRLPERVKLRLMPEAAG